MSLKKMEIVVTECSRCDGKYFTVYATGSQVICSSKAEVLDFITHKIEKL